MVGCALSVEVGRDYLTWLHAYMAHLDRTGLSDLVTCLRDTPSEMRSCSVNGCKTEFMLTSDRATVSEKWEQTWMPFHPMASDHLYEGVYRAARGAALQRRYIQANPDAMSNLMIVDVDHPDAVLRALSTKANNHPMPTAIVENRRNGHAHALWALCNAIIRTEYARRGPLAYAAAVTEGLRRALGGDAGYSGFLTKNPVHEDWDTLWLAEDAADLYSLSQLEAQLGDHMPPKQWRRQRRKNPVGLGRNCAIFESARTWAYREVRHHFGDSEGLRVAILNHVLGLNSKFSEPLPVAEAHGIARSIHKWIVTKSRIWKDGPVVYDATFSTIQSHRGRRSRPGRRGIDIETLKGEAYK